LKVRGADSAVRSAKSTAHGAKLKVRGAKSTVRSAELKVCSAKSTARGAESAAHGAKLKVRLAEFLRCAVRGKTDANERKRCRNIPKSTPYVICSPYAICAVAGKRIHLPGGSLLPSAIEQSSFQLAAEKYTFVGGMTQPESGGLMTLALQYLGTPYLWGGKTIFGINCSGLVQIICRMAGYWLPRDASQQAQTGREVTFDTAVPMILPFFVTTMGK
jgi:hypothetical protein